ncbi:MAG: DUF4959 domain-containing protein [Bacteroidales bacterium]|jgi:hypothetical protein|nr:DUF4959 domain-containing protein [Bacteroidales bacterium]
MKTIKKYICLMAVALTALQSCREEGRFELYSGDTVAPGKPTIIDWEPFFGGVIIYFQPSDDEDLLSINAEYTNVNGRTFSFAASYFTNAITVSCMGSTDPHTVRVYAMDRTGNKSEAVPVIVRPDEPIVQRVASTVSVKPAFGSFMVEWVNGLMADVNVYVDFSFTQNGIPKSFTQVFSSSDDSVRMFVENLDLTHSEPVTVRARVEDYYDNSSVVVELGQIILLTDELLPKAGWSLPDTKTEIGGVPQCFGDSYEGKLRFVIDDIIDEGFIYNYMHTGSRGYNGNADDGNLPWNVLIDLGDYYELSRIITHQRHYAETLLERGQYYQDENVGIYNMYIWDEDLQQWDFVSQRKIPIPNTGNLVELLQKARAGDFAYLYPDEPKYTKPTRWFRYEAVVGFANDYTSILATSLSEITLYGRKVNR